MKIIINQQNKKIEVIFKQGGYVDKYLLDKADDFLNTLDKFTRKRKMGFIHRANKSCKTYKSYGTDKMDFRGAKLEIKQVSLLTERIIRAILQAISWQR